MGVRQPAPAVCPCRCPCELQQQHGYIADLAEEAGRRRSRTASTAAKAVHFVTTTERDQRAKTEADVVHEPWTDDVPQLRAAVSFTVAARSAREASLCVLCESRVHIRKPSQLRTAFAAK